ncbi:hypothetical protein SB48_HM08orf00625 [Heyndrickxia coagulans]|uniref:Uncharacterized protein n=1 Tax=Heyndrickxia coagulans TaxID=1398 RepID=A0AAN0T3K5_HEYCO|nr:hypothetical protein SB48_HM08orf00625 [Heyndrickxia coagulans]
MNTPFLSITPYRITKKFYHKKSCLWTRLLCSGRDMMEKKQNECVMRRGKIIAPQ